MARPTLPDPGADVSVPRPVEPRDVAVIVPVGGAAPMWSRAARSLARLDPAPGEIVVVVDGPNEEQEAHARELDATVVVLPASVGPGQARNLGVERTEKPILLFLDSDVEAPPDLIDEVAARFGRDGAPSACIGSYDDAPGDPGFFSQYRNLLHHFVHQEAREEASTFWAGCGAIRRDVFLDAGGYDPRYGEPSIEDIELGARVRRRGESIRLDKDLQVKHLKRWRFVEMMRTDLLRRAIPWTELMLREGEIVNDLNVRSRDRASVALAGLALVALGLGVRWPPLLLGAALCLAGIVVLNGRLFRFYRRKRGMWFAGRVLPAYWLYLLVCGVGFSVGAARHALGGARA